MASLRPQVNLPVLQQISKTHGIHKVRLGNIHALENLYWVRIQIVRLAEVLRRIPAETAVPCSPALERPVPPSAPCLPLAERSAGQTQAASRSSDLSSTTAAARKFPVLPLRLLPRGAKAFSICLLFSCASSRFRYKCMILSTYLCAKSDTAHQDSPAVPPDAFSAHLRRKPGTCRVILFLLRIGYVMRDKFVPANTGSFVSRIPCAS